MSTREEYHELLESVGEDTKAPQVRKMLDRAYKLGERAGKEGTVPGGLVTSKLFPDLPSDGRERGACGGRSSPKRSG